MGPSILYRIEEPIGSCDAGRASPGDGRAAGKKDNRRASCLTIGRLATLSHLAGGSAPFPVRFGAVDLCGFFASPSPSEWLGPGNPSFHGAGRRPPVAIATAGSVESDPRSPR